MYIIGACLTICLIGYLVMVGIATSAFRALTTEQEDQFPLISVLIASRNEEDNLLALLTSLQHQSYPKDGYEVLIIDDHSEDSSEQLVRRWLDEHPSSNVRYIPTQGHGKKSAITTGLGQAVGDWILQTDADCLPPVGWIQGMAQGMTEDMHFLSGPVRLREGTSWLTKLQALEVAGLVSLGAGSMAAGFPNMANGANMAYRRQTFLEIGGFESAKHVASGDDEFLVQAISAKYSRGLNFVKRQDVIIETDAAPDWKSFRNQRIRWVSKARFYTNKMTNGLQMMSWLGFLAFPFWALMGVWYPQAWLFGGGLFLLKVLVDRWLMISGTVFLHRRRWMKWFLLLELVYIPYVIWIGVRGNFPSAYSWKGRLTR